MPAGAAPGIVVRDLGLRPLESVWTDMRALTDGRGPDTADEIWFVEHPPVFTLGLNADRAHVLDPGPIPVVQIDRGGQVTYHGPGQVVAYVMLDVRRLGLNIRGLVEALEGAVIDTVAAYGVEAAPRRDAPGVYVDGRKLAAVGLRLRRHCSYHGIAVNVAMDLAPFRSIDPCGYPDLEVTQLADLCAVDDPARFRRDLAPRLIARLLG
ncbi:MAG: lipoyl(octanoyl) transferase LipB [Gammaproteobacteria bacterium]|nr:lipoyl(octanoyl) transferase LipB [Gammaproteobacteria bacterium]